MTKLTMPPIAKRRKTSVSESQEITWDSSARQEYLTGFHKRKQQRIQHAQKAAAEKERMQRIQDRKQIRDQRRKDLDRHVQQVNEAVKSAERSFLDTAGDSAAADSDSAHGSEADSYGSEGEPPSAHENNYVDEDKYTTVTVEAMTEADTMKLAVQDEVLKGTSADSHLRKTSATKAARKKHKPFRYETRAERKNERLQHGIKKAKAAQTRRVQH